MIYTTNTVEGYHRQIRKVTKNKGVFPNDTALEKLVYLAYRNIRKKWTMPLANWGTIAQQLAIKFGDRFKLLLFYARRECWCTPLALADPRPMSLKEKQRMTQFTLRPQARMNIIFIPALSFWCIYRFFLVERIVFIFIALSVFLGSLIVSFAKLFIEM